MGLTVLEICAGAGGQAIGLEAAGFELASAIEIDSHACNTLRQNRPHWRVINASWFGVSQLRPRFVLVAFRGKFPESFQWPEQNGTIPPTVGEVLEDLMASRDWKGVEKWRRRAMGIAPTLVGGSKKHGG